MKSLISLVFLLCFSTAQAADVVLVSIFGKQMGPKVEDFQAVNAKIGSLVANFKLKKFEILAYGIEGGYVACLEPSINVEATDLLKEMLSVSIDSAITMYSSEIKPSCK